MRTIRPSKTKLLFLLPTLALPLAILVASVMAVPQPIAVAPELEPTSSKLAEPTPSTRIYHAFISPVTVTLPAKSGTLSILLGVALPETEGRALEKKLQDNPDAILGNLATAVLETIDSTGTRTDAAQLRQILPGALQTTMNANLVAMGEPPDILEVLIIDWALVP